MKNRIFITIILGAMLCACAAKPKTSIITAPLPLMQPPKPVETQTSDPADFERSMPKSSILKKSLFVFENTYPRLYSDDGILGVAAGEKMLADLKENYIGFTMPYCPSLVTDDEYDKIKVDGFIALIYGRSKIALYSAAECARFAKQQRYLKGDVAYIDGKIIEWEGSRVLLRDAITSKVLYDGDTGLAVATPGEINGSIVLIHYNGYITYYDLKAKAFAFKGQFPVVFSDLHFAEGKFYGLEKGTNKLFMITEKDSMLSSEENCITSLTSPYGLCGDKLIGFKKNFNGVPESNNFSANDGFFADLKNGNMNIYSMNNSWQRFLMLDYNLPNPCKDKKGDIYFTGFSGYTIVYSHGVEKFVKKRPDKCEIKSIKVEGGDFVCDGKPCGTYATKMLKEGSDTMFRRIEDGKRYYYFNGLNSSHKTR